MVFYNRYTNRPKFKGETFKEPSKTVPGQDMTPQDIMRTYTQAKPQNMVFRDEDLHSFQRMDKIEQSEVLQQTREHTQTIRQEFDEKVDILKQNKQKQKEASERKKIEQQVRDEFTKKDVTRE